jgi:hypothetical protein
LFSFAWLSGHTGGHGLGWRAAMSLLEFRAQLPGFEGRAAHSPFGPGDTPGCPGQRGEPMRPAVLLGVRDHLAAAVSGEQAADV